MPEVRYRKTVFVKTLIGATGTFTHRFDIGFIPDELIVRSHTAGLGGGGGDGSYTVQLEGFGDLFSFTKEQSDTPLNIFRMTNSIDGNRTFTVRNVGGTIETGITALGLIFCLEFVQYYPVHIGV